EGSRLRTNRALSLQALEEAIALYQKLEKWEKVYLLAMQTVEQAKGIKEKGVEGMVIGAEAKFKLGQEKIARKMLAEVLQRSGRKSSSKKGGSEGETDSITIAKARLLLAESEMKRFERIELVAPLDRNLERKKALFNKLLKAYGRAAGAASPLVALPATHRMGELFEAFSRSLLQSERPKELSSEEREMYERLLKEQALPYLQKAEEAYQRNMSWGRKTGVENEWVTRSREQFRLIHQEIDSFKSGGVLKG
ncbi:MAG TPA: hypothetical protein VIK48_05660, partial [Candidatus Manganitrophaceae bacterium]